MKIEIIACAEEELAEAVDYYNEQSQGLGHKFAKEVKCTFNRILRLPEAWPNISINTRRCITSKFPYGIIYQIRKKRILVIAVMHMRRDPRRWQDRIKQFSDKTI